MSMRVHIIALTAVLGFLCAGAATAEDCISCHQKITPNIVSDWQLSTHSQNEVECMSCHGDEHTTAEDVAKVEIPTAETCKTCHEEKVEQFKSGKHAAAWAAMKALPTAHWQPMALMEGMKGCGGCHKIGIKSEEDINDIKRKGVGFGVASCDACHTRHVFSVKEARQPQACQTCHMGFDHPQWEMYSASKHGVRLPDEAKQSARCENRRAKLPDLPHAGRQSCRQDGLGISCCSTPHACRRNVGRRPHHHFAGPGRARS